MPRRPGNHGGRVGSRKRSPKGRASPVASIMTGLLMIMFVAVACQSRSPMVGSSGLFRQPEQDNPLLAISDRHQAAFADCPVGGGTNCVVDGDTFWLDREKIRIADIDTPETHPPRCAREADLGERATTRLRSLLNSGPFSLHPANDGRSHDHYGRRLAIVTRNGSSLGQMLVSEGLARPYSGGPRQPWC